ncbi:Hemimethylated DNA-binding protein YccV like-domain-containing protein [Dendryphion nanum]|uniref:Hemimethylated DNA-binding protein YccV like-domain-containing protein n=1 Tax=Dendryphion nanum TaxID=256645 RepID=A0A9P9IWK4_9PLEO|nr:Hemimethylated DNA-binding protein YccV like-domain-containing protein [Dendryphion nanum]
MATVRPSFTTLPTEILEAIFLHLDPHSFVFVSHTCKTIHKITESAPVVWRHFCKTHFNSWAPRHDIATKFRGPLSQVNWRGIFVSRVHNEKRALELLDTLLESQQERIKNITEIADFGYDAKDVLLRECACPDDADDVLARRYYANAVLERIQRDIVIQVWKDLAAGKHVPIERALGAFDLFARTGSDVDFDHISQDLDQLAQDVLKLYPDFKQQSTRMKASLLASFLRERGFKGVSDVSYGALRNSFIGLALHTPPHESLPLISVAIYCALASRLDLDARPCGFVFHVYTIVYAPKNYTLDDVYKPTSADEVDNMYLDPFRSSDEVPLFDLQEQLRSYGIPGSEYDRYLSHATTREMVIRTARNIINSVQTIRETERSRFGVQSNWLNAYPDMDSSFYATIWAMLILGPSDEEHGALSNLSTRRRQYLPYLLEHFQVHYPWDITLLEQHVIPLFDTQPEGNRLRDFVRSMHRADSMAKAPKPRYQANDAVTMKIGQLFKHKRYSYEGVITGWDTACEAGEDWIQHMGVDRLLNGREQSFYHVLVCDKSVRYVAGENISPAPSSVQPSEALLKIAGRHFKRWDDVNHVFVSNIRDEYPED